MRSVAADPQVQMLTFLDQGREPADLGTGGFRDQPSWEPLQLRQQDGNLLLVETVSR
jgi:hypothetical protein